MGATTQAIIILRIMSIIWDDHDDMTQFDEIENNYWDDTVLTDTISEPLTNSNFDTDQYDEVYANYYEAKRQMNDLRTSRGFYPIVAIVPEYSSQKGKGKAKGYSKGKGKGKGSRSNANFKPKG